MQDFLFSPRAGAHARCSVLSGGERGRLMLARALAKPSNLLVLDEPTNDLDLETLDVLEEMLGDYAGTVILISHDRDFLDRVVNCACWCRRATAAGSSTPAATPTCWRSAAPTCACAAGAEVGQRPRASRSRRAGARGKSGQAPAQLQREARAGDAAGADRGACRPGSARCSSGSTTRRSTRATAPPSRHATEAPGDSASGARRGRGELARARDPARGDRGKAESSLVAKKRSGAWNGGDPGARRVRAGSLLRVASPGMRRMPVKSAIRRCYRKDYCCCVPRWSAQRRWTPRSRPPRASRRTTPATVFCSSVREV